MDTAVNRPELLLVADAVAREKSIERDDVLEAMEQAIQKAGRAKYGHEKDIRAVIDRKTGDVRLSRWTEIVETVENEETQIRSETRDASHPLAYIRYLPAYPLLLFYQLPDLPDHLRLARSTLADGVVVSPSCGR